MKNLLISIIVFLSFFCVSLYFNTNAVANTKSGEVLTIPPDNPYYEIKEIANGKKRLIFEYDGPGGKLVNVWVESND